jgi:hypothetical protein
MMVPPNSNTKKKKETNMKLFAIDAENTITTFPAAEQIPEGQERFSSENELFAAASMWPTERLVQIWNSFAGVAGFGVDLKPVKKFTNRNTGVKRIWNAIQALDGSPEAAAAPPEAATATAAATAPAKAAKAPKAPKVAKGAKKAAKAAPAKAKASKTTKVAKPTTPSEKSKKAIVIDMMKRKGGATLNEIAEETGWARHTIRGFVSIAGSKLGLTIESSKNEAGERKYRVK